jgi:short-subunit dehydrogenase
MKKSVLIIGGSSDVALALAQIYAENKYELFLTFRNEKQGKNIASDLSIRYGIKCTPLLLDINEPQKIQEFTDQIDVVPEITICCAGYLGDQDLAEREMKEALQIINVNYTGVVLLINKIAAIYQERRSGSIAVFSSVAGERGRQSNYMYGSAKAGLTAYLSGLRNKLNSSNVSVLSVIPGFMLTRMTEDLDLPKMLTAKPTAAAKAVFKAIEKKKNIVYVLWYWKYIMLIIKSIPEGIFKKLKL